MVVPNPRKRHRQGCRVGAGKRSAAEQQTNFVMLHIMTDGAQQQSRHAQRAKVFGYASARQLQRTCCQGMRKQVRQIELALAVKARACGQARATHQAIAGYQRSVFAFADEDMLGLMVVGIHLSATACCFWRGFGGHLLVENAIAQVLRCGDVLFVGGEGHVEKRSRVGRKIRRGFFAPLLLAPLLLAPLFFAPLFTSLLRFVCG